jgi:hypothetical protein
MIADKAFELERNMEGVVSFGTDFGMCGFLRNDN